MSSRRSSLSIYVPLLLVLVYVCAVSVAGTDMESRIRALRYWSLLGMGVFAVSAPHVLLPDRQLRLMQRLNRSPQNLLRHQLRQWQPVVGLFILPTLVLAFWDPGNLAGNLPEKAANAIAIILLLLGTAAYSFMRYVRIGPLSQQWQEGTKGDWYRTVKENSPGGFAVPEGMVPAMLATQRVFAVGLLALVAAAWLGQSVDTLLALAPGGLLLAGVTWSLMRSAHRHDQAYYATNAFYGEVFRGAGGVRISSREAVPFRSVYWSPKRYKPHLWAALRQFDRKLPLGRLMVMAHGLLWFLFYIDASSYTVTAYLLLLITSKNAASFVITQPGFAPLPFHLARQSNRGWVITRFLVNLRWTLPLLMSLFIVALFDPSLSFANAFGWTALDIMVGLATAFLFTYRTEYRYRQRLA